MLIWDLPVDHFILLLGAAFAAGALNAVAGGGSFLTLAALVFTGVSPLVANATGTVAQLPGYMAGAWGFRSDMQPPPGMRMGQVVAMSLLGGSAGAALLLFTPPAVFNHLVPWLLLVATALFAFGPQLRQWASGRQQPAGATKTGAGTGMRGALGVFAVAVYGGYFNGGLGIVLLALFSLMGQTNLNTMNGMKNLVSALLAAIAVAIYAAGDIVAWREAAIMMVAATAGGYGGARVARKLPTAWLRWGIVAIGLVLSALFFFKNS